MIIKRRFVPFCDLYHSDEKTRKVLDYAISSIGYDELEKEHLIKYNTERRTSQFNADMGDCIPNFNYIIKEFKRLDKEIPYDNGFSLSDVNDIKGVGWDDDNITLMFVTIIESTEYPVAVINIKEDPKTKKLKLGLDKSCVYNII